MGRPGLSPQSTKRDRNKSAIAPDRLGAHRCRRQGLVFLPLNYLGTRTGRTAATSPGVTPNGYNVTHLPSASRPPERAELARRAKQSVVARLCWTAQGDGGHVGQFGPLEAAVMDVLWTRDGSATVREVLEVVSRDRPLAYTTVMSVLDNLFRKGWVVRHRDGKAYQYRPAMTRDVYSADLMAQALSTGADPQAVFLHLVAQMSPEETAHLRAALRRSGRTRS